AHAVAAGVDVAFPGTELEIGVFTDAVVAGAVLAPALFTGHADGVAADDVAAVRRTAVLVFRAWCTDGVAAVARITAAIGWAIHRLARVAHPVAAFRGQQLATAAAHAFTGVERQISAAATSNGAKRQRSATQGRPDSP